jgi:hypothetical protein
MKKKLNKLGVENSLWNNIRANEGSGKKPTAAMLKQEKKIKATTKMQSGGVTTSIVKPKKKSGRDIDPGFITGGKPTKNLDPGFYDIKNKIKNDTVPKRKIQYDTNGGIHFKKGGSTPAWTRKEGKNPTGGLNAKGVASYRKENPGSKLQTAVTTKPSKLDPDSKDAKRRKSFCARMSGVDGPMKDEKGRPTRKALALRKWNC